MYFVQGYRATGARAFAKILDTRDQGSNAGDGFKQLVSYGNSEVAEVGTYFSG